MTCAFCGSTDFTSHHAREMMHGFRDEFVYMQCKSCGCMKIASVPDDLSRYYPVDSYYSYAVKQSLRTRLGRQRLRIAVNNSWLGLILGSIKRLQTLDWIRMFGLERNMRILDVGSGAASFVRDLRCAGFTGALGVDPFISRDLHDENGLIVQKAYLSDIGGEWDCITFHHSLEHIADQIGTLVLVRGKLSHRGQCIVRIPVVNWAWQHYGTDWVQLDAPRHLCIHTEKSFRMAVAKAGLRVTRVIYDSDEFQIWASELYRKNIPLQTGLKDRAKYFSPAELRKFRHRANELNTQGLGDQAVFFLETMS